MIMALRKLVWLTALSGGLHSAASRGLFLLSLFFKSPSSDGDEEKEYRTVHRLEMTLLKHRYGILPRDQSQNVKKQEVD